ncbi:hypothetical protein A6410_11685 [Prescottella equi]|nr:hypothetical protein A6410_11685 [Prescottella equi]
MQRIRDPAGKLIASPTFHEHLNLVTESSSYPAIPRTFASELTPPEGVTTFSPARNASVTDAMFHDMQQ